MAGLAAALREELAPDERLTPLRHSASPFALQQHVVIPRLLRQLDAGLYHSPYYLMPWRPGVPTVVTVHDLIPLRLPQLSTRLARWFFRLAVTRALRTAGRVITGSASAGRDLLAAFPAVAARLRVIPYAAGASFRPQTDAARAASRARLTLPARFVLYVGSNRPHKNLPRLMEAWSRLQPQPLPLVIAGAWDPRYPGAQQRAAALGLNDKVLWLGPVAETELPGLYAAATIFVFPSLYEGFGLPVIEAMACGTPVACSGTSSLPEVAGEAAILFDPEQTESIADALSRLLASPALRVEQAELGLRRAAEFSWPRTARETLDVYRELLGEK